MGTRTLIFDVETTGLAPFDRVVSIAGIWCDGLELTGEHFYLVFNPKKASHPAATAAHGLSDWWLRYQPCIESHIGELLTAFGRAELLVGHNVGFDIRMMSHEFAHFGAPEIKTDFFCTMQASRGLGGRNLDACLKTIGLQRSGAIHSAYEDTLLTMNLYRWLKGCKDCVPVPLPLPEPSNAVCAPKEVMWADVVDSTPSGCRCPEPPECVIAMLAELGIEVTGHSPRTARMLLAAHDYARMVAKRRSEHETAEQMRTLICALADADAFHEPLVEWSRWAWGRPNPQVPRNALRQFAEEMLTASIS